MADGAILGQRAVTLPTDTTANRPSAVVGMIRYNTTLGVIEYSDGTSWYTIGTTGSSASSTIVSGATTGKAIAMAMVFGG